MQRTFGPGEFERFEGAPHERVMGLERDLLAAESAAHDGTDKDARAVAALEARLGIIDFRTPRAAKQALWDVSQLVPKKAEELFTKIGNMQPSNSGVDRLPRMLSKRWEADRAPLGEALRAGLVVCTA